MNSKNEELNLNNSREKENNLEDLSFKKLVLWTLEPLERMKWLAITSEAVFSKYQKKNFNKLILTNFYKINFFRFKRSPYPLSNLLLCQLLRS